MRSRMRKGVRRFRLFAPCPFAIVDPCGIILSPCPFSESSDLARRADGRGGDRLSARLPRRLQSRRHRAARPHRQHRRIAEEPGHPRLHLREGAEIRRARVRRGPDPVSGGPHRRQGSRQVQACDAGTLPSTSWPIDSARAKAEAGGASILPFSYGGSNGLLTQDNLDAQLWRRFGASRLARTVCAAPTGAANQALYGKMPSVTYQDYPEAALIVLWGVNPSASGIHLVPYVREAQKRGATLVVVDPRTTALARSADLHLPVKPGTDVAVALAIHRHLFENGHADDAFLREHATGADRLRERAAPWTIERAADVAGLDRSALERFAALYAAKSPALIRCGWGLERNRNGGSAAMAVLALPAVGGKFGVRGGGYSMSNSASWGIERTWIRDEEPPTRLVNMNHLGRALTEYDDPRGLGAVRLQLQPGGDDSRSAPRPPRPRAERPVHRRLRAGDDRHGALCRCDPAGDDVPRRVRFRQGVRPDRDGPRPAGDRRQSARRDRTPTCSASCARGWDCSPTMSRQTSSS